MDRAAAKAQIGFIVIVLGMLPAAPLQAADFYAGKTIDFIIGGNPGGGFDIYARALTRHLSRHIPGRPTIVAKNMPGAGSAKAGIHVANIAPKDGLSIGAVTPGAITGPLFDDRPNALFMPNKVIWIGSADSASRVCATYQTSKIKRFEDMLAHRAVIGGGSHGDATHDYAHMVGKVTNARIDVVAGYKGTLDTALAMERGEIDGMCGWGWSSVKSQKPEWVRDGKLNMVLQIGPQENAELTRMGAPPLWRFVKDENSRRVADVIVSQQAFTRPYFVAMGTPAAAVQILRQAFNATMADAQFLADAERMRVDISPLPGAEVQKLIESFYATPRAIVEQARRTIRP